MTFDQFEFILILIYFLIRVYRILDSKVMYSKNGSKLDKYIKQVVSKDISNNLVEHNEKEFDLKVFFQKSIQILKSKRELKILLITITFLSIKLMFSYTNINSNFYYIKLFSKNIDLVSLLYPNFKFIYILYLNIYTICIYDIVKIVTRKIIKFKRYSKITKKNNYNLDIQVGNDKDGKVVSISEMGLYQNILITGSIGTGKTSTAINNILFTLIKNKLGGLVIDVKGNYTYVLKKMCTICNRNEDLVEISLDSKFRYNPLDTNLSNIELAYMLKKVLMLLSSTNNSDGFWLDKVEAYLRDFIVIIKLYMEYPSFSEIHKLVTNDEYLNSKLNLVKEKILSGIFSDEDLFAINSAISNIKNEYLRLDERTRSIIKAEITRITGVFVNDYNIYQKFCFNSDAFSFLENKVVILSIGIGENSLLCKIISTYLKLDFQRQILSQNSNYKTTFFVCDEYQEIANKEDSHFFSISREFKCINVVSMQSYSSLVNSLNEEAATKVIIQNFVNKIWFRNDDNYTVEQIIKQIGKEKKKYENMSVSENGNNTKYNVFTNRFNDYKTGISKSYSYNMNLDYKLGEEYMTTTLKTFEAAAMLSDGQEVRFVDKIKLKIWEGDKYNK